jgi:hypothetical protein
MLLSVVDVFCVLCCANLKLCRVSAGSLDGLIDWIGFGLYLPYNDLNPF